MNSDLNSDASSVFQTKQFYQLLLAYADSELTSWGDRLPSMVAYLTRDGSIKFSAISPLGIGQEIIEESRLSDRLLVIISFAYLEDQIRLLLAKFLVEDKVTRNLLNTESLPFLKAARLAFSLGLIAREWFEILDEMAEFRNKFAHRPFAQSFEDLINEDEKETQKSLDKLSRLYKQITQRELNGIIHNNFLNLFLYMYPLIQFSIDHIATINPRKIFDDKEIVGMSHVMGFTREDIQVMIDNNFGKDNS